MHQLNTDRQDIMRHRDRYLEPLEHHSVMNTRSVFHEPLNRKVKGEF